jgi:hypothetical protein
MLVVVERYNTQWKVFTESSQLRCTEHQLKLTGLHFQLKKVARQQNTRLAVTVKCPAGFPGLKWSGQASSGSGWRFCRLLGRLFHFFLPNRLETRQDFLQ